MNSLVFDPRQATVYQWAPIELSQPQIEDFQLIVDRTCNYLIVISNKKIKYLPLNSKCPKNYKKIDEKHPPRIKYKKLKKLMTLEDEKRIEKVIEQLHTLKIKFEAEYKRSQKLNPQKEKMKQVRFEQSQEIIEDDQKGSLVWKAKLKVCQAHLQQMKMRVVYFYDQFMQKQNKLLQTFVHFKLNQLYQKMSNITDYLHYVSFLQGQSQIESLKANIRIIFDNLYIQGEYLRVFIKKNLSIFQNHSYYEYSGDEPEVLAIRKREFGKLKMLEKETQELKQQIRELYFHNYGLKRSKLIIKNPRKLEQVIKEEVAVYRGEYKNVDPWITWLNGFICSILIIAMAAIITFRQVNINELEAQSDYQMQFQVWRGASYLIWFNWVFALAFYLLVKWKINYKLVLLEKDNIVGKYQSFFWTASLLSTVYMLLFLTYLLNQLEYITDYPQVKNMGYFMWIINIVFLLNPFKILNYHSRFYFLILFKKFLLWQQSASSMQIAFLSLIIASCAQPFNDLAFTVCSLTSSDLSSCKSQSRISTFVFMMIYLVYRIILMLKIWYSSKQGANLIKTKMRFVSILCSLNTVVSGFLYRTFASQGLLVYWIISAGISTIAVTNAEVRADWNIGNFNKEDGLVRYVRVFSPCVYYVCAIVDLFLNIAWTLTITNNVEIFLNIDVLYFFMLLAFVELWRRGMWIVFRIEEAHSHYVANLKAMADDSEICDQIQRVVDPLRSQNKTIQCQVPGYDDNVVIVLQYLADKYLNYQCQQPKLQSLQPRLSSNRSISLKSDNYRKFPEVTLKQIQAMILSKKKYIKRVRTFLSQLEEYLGLIYESYQELTWEDEY